MVSWMGPHAREWGLAGCSYRPRVDNYKFLVYISHIPFRPRLAAPAVLKASRQFPVVMLTGARQVGKTTLLRHLDPRRSWVSLDDMDVRRMAREDPRQFFERFPPPVFIDEFQYAPEILPRIKLWVDERRTRLKPAAGAFWLPGSQNFAMMEGVQESLAGRVAVLRLSGFSLPETGAPAAGAPALFNALLRGDKPELWTRRGLDRETFYSSCVQTCLERDVRGQLGVRQLGLFDKFMRLLAARVGQLLNMASVSSDLGVSIPTVKEWLTVLERSDQVLLLPPYFASRGKRLVRTPNPDGSRAREQLQVHGRLPGQEDPVRGGQGQDGQHPARGVDAGVLEGRARRTGRGQPVRSGRAASSP